MLPGPLICRTEDSTVCSLAVSVSRIEARPTTADTHLGMQNDAGWDTLRALTFRLARFCGSSPFGSTQPTILWSSQRCLLPQPARVTTVAVSSRRFLQRTVTATSRYGQIRRVNRQT